jgi:transcriptional regulator with XRE-family HTH domain
MTARPSPDPMSSMWAWLAYDLRFYRERAGLSGTEMGKKLGCVRSTVSRLESGELKIDEKQAGTLDEYFRTGGHFLRLLTYAKLGHDPDWFKEHISYEARASVIKLYESLLVPGLLQTPEYARALISASRAPGADEYVAARLARQEILTKEPPPFLWVLLFESVLDIPVGGPKVMRGQLARLLEMGELPNVTIRVVPRAVGAHVGLDGSFKILTVREGSVAYMDAQVGGRLALDGTVVQTLEIRYDQIGAEALSRDSSQSLIASVLETMK